MTVESNDHLSFKVLALVYELIRTVLIICQFGYNRIDISNFILSNRSCDMTLLRWTGEMTYIYILSFTFNWCFIVMVTSGTETKTETC